VARAERAVRTATRKKPNCSGGFANRAVNLEPPLIEALSSAVVYVGYIFRSLGNKS